MARSGVRFYPFLSDETQSPGDFLVTSGFLAVPQDGQSAVGAGSIILSRDGDDADDQPPRSVNAITADDDGNNYRGCGRYCHVWHEHRRLSPGVSETKGFRALPRTPDLPSMPCSRLFDGGLTTFVRRFPVGHTLAADALDVFGRNAEKLSAAIREYEPVALNPRTDGLDLLDCVVLESDLEVQQCHDRLIFL
jgi:hypothetical protein